MSYGNFFDAGAGAGFEGNGLFDDEFYQGLPQAAEPNALGDFGYQNGNALQGDNAFGNFGYQDGNAFQGNGAFGDDDFLHGGAFQGQDAFGDNAFQGEHNGFDQNFPPAFNQAVDPAHDAALEEQFNQPPADGTPQPDSPTHQETHLRESIDNPGATALNDDDKVDSSPTSRAAAHYRPQPHILAQHPEPTTVTSQFYNRLTASRFRTSAEAKAHRKRARMPPKSKAEDVARVKKLGREYWVCRIFNSMIDTAHITDSSFSTNRARFEKQAVFDHLDLEAAAHHVFDEAIAVHERGWNRPTVYHKSARRGKLVDISEESLELRLTRICSVLRETKSTVDDVMRGGVTLALLCDNPEARKHTKASNDTGNAKRGERLRQTATKQRVKKAKQESPEAGGSSNAQNLQEIEGSGVLESGNQIQEGSQIGEVSDGED
ncbi:hypothetical protein E8E13_004715 [Curvularia kusanoi]|uniref:Uncharacterized protein n=1 Tax=Curvularia kusanoi TaxID=90978 RepID=A0A9P4WC67_CURKU|nr:hypothetical protein E8E13_004715 [Curvularia kusanoi]